MEATHEHAFERLNDHQLFCKCGATKDVPSTPALHCEHHNCAVIHFWPHGCCNHLFHCWCGGHHQYHTYTSTAAPVPVTWWSTGGNVSQVTAGTTPNGTSFNITF